jgi:hypothetical protein
MALRASNYEGTLPKEPGVFDPEHFDLGEVGSGWRCDKHAPLCCEPPPRPPAPRPNKALYQYRLNCSLYVGLIL